MHGNFNAIFRTSFLFKNIALVRGIYFGLQSMKMLNSGQKRIIEYEWQTWVAAE